MAQDDRPMEQPAVRTTIVGGRPPGSGKTVGPIPRGIEVLIKKAAVDPAFKMLLLAKRDGAAKAIDLTLEAAEAMMLKAAPRAQLEAIIAQTSVHPSVLPAFLGRAAAVMLVALGAGTLGCDKVEVTDGIAPDRPPAKRVEPSRRTPVPEGVRPDRPQAVERSPGIRPDRIPTPQPPKATESTAPEPAPQSYGMAGIQPAAPERIEPTDGVRPDRPPEAKPKAETPTPPAPKPQPPAPTGIRPDRPPAARPKTDEPSAAPSATATEPITSTPTSGERITRGIRPSRPQTKPKEDVPPEKKPIISQALTLPATWDEKTTYAVFANGLKRLADKHLPKHKFTYSVADSGQRYIRVEFKPKVYDVPSTDPKTGETTTRRKTGPEADGLLLTVWIEKRLTEADRPHVRDNAGLWKTKVGQMFLRPLKTYLKSNVHYGPKTDKAQIAVFSSPQAWLTAHAQPDPGAATSRGARPDRPQTKGIRPDRPKAKDE